MTAVLMLALVFLCALTAFIAAIGVIVSLMLATWNQPQNDRHLVFAFKAFLVTIAAICLFNWLSEIPFLDFPPIFNGKVFK